MSDKITTTEAEKTTVTFGVGNAEARNVYRDAVREADHVYSDRVDEIRKPLNDAVDAVLGLLGYGSTADALCSLLRAQALPNVNRQVSEAQQARDLAIEEAKERRKADTTADAFFTFVDRDIRDNYDDDYANTLIEHMPFTFDSLKALAWDQDWCSDYESVMRRATREGALPEETVEVRWDVRVYDVPARYDAQPGERWQKVGTFPAYARITYRDGSPRAFYDIERWAIGDVRYEKVTDAPIEDTTPDTGEDNDNPPF
jgi:hypothetical protein